VIRTVVTLTLISEFGISLRVIRIPIRSHCWLRVYTPATGAVGRNLEEALATEAAGRNPQERAVVTGVGGDDPKRAVLKLVPDEYWGGLNACVELSLSYF